MSQSRHQRRAQRERKRSGWTEQPERWRVEAAWRAAVERVRRDGGGVPAAGLNHQSRRWFSAAP